MTCNIDTQIYIMQLTLLEIGVKLLIGIKQML
nr:MAG TPA: hypothetical protein [Caudoviricetes sp.]